MNNEFYAVCERATDLMHIAIINKDYGKAELAYFKTLEEAEEFLRNLELYKEVLYFFNESEVVSGFGRVYIKTPNSLVVDKNGKPRTCKCLPYDQMHID